MVITVRPGADAFDARSDLHLEDVVLDDPDATAIDAFEVTDITVGWLAG